MKYYGQYALQSLCTHDIRDQKLRGVFFYKCSSCITRKLCIKQPVSKTKLKNTKQQHVEKISTPPISDELLYDV